MVEVRVFSFFFVLRSGVFTTTPEQEGAALRHPFALRPLNLGAAEGRRRLARF